MYLFNREKPEIYRNMHIGNNIGGEINGSYNSSLGTTGLGVELRKEFLASNNLGHRERLMTVSYTHLDVYKRQVLQAGEGQAPARQAALGAGLSNETPSTTCLLYTSRCV